VDHIQCELLVVVIAQADAAEPRYDLLGEHRGVPCHDDTTFSEHESDGLRSPSHRAREDSSSSDKFSGIDGGFHFQCVSGQPEQCDGAGRNAQ